MLGIRLFAPCGLAAQATTTAASHLQGTVFSGVPEKPQYASGAKLTLYGDTGTVSTVTDQNGKFAFTNVEPPEIYFIEANYMGLHAGRNAMVHAGTVVQVSLPLEAPGSNLSASW